MDRYEEDYEKNPLRSPETWSILPGIAGLAPGRFIPNQGITLERQAMTLWSGVLIYKHFRSVEATRWMAILGSIWGSGSDIYAIYFAKEEEPLIRRVESDPWFKGKTQPAGMWRRDHRVSGEWEEAPGRALAHYRELDRRWLEIRDSPRVTEPERDAHLEEMDVAWEALTEDEKALIETEMKTESSMPEMVDVPTEGGVFPRRLK